MITIGGIFTSASIMWAVIFWRLMDYVMRSPTMVMRHSGTVRISSGFQLLIIYFIGLYIINYVRDIYVG